MENTYFIYQMDRRPERLETICRVQGRSAESAVDGLKQAIKKGYVKTPEDYSGIILVYSIEDDYEASIPIIKRKRLSSGVPLVLQGTTLPWEEES